MPKSSGGGSHSSGSHHSSGSSHSYSSGGGSHSSGSSYSSSRSYSSGGYSSYSSGSSYSGSSRSYSGSSYSRTPVKYIPPRVSREAFTGAKRYVSYRNNVPHYIYSNVKPSSYEGGVFAGLFRGILKITGWLNVAMLVLLVGAFIYAFVGLKPVSADYDRRIVIADNAGIMENTAELEASMSRFLDITGITPAVMTVNNEDWQPYYAALENYAFDLYVNNFSDEYHWLWVYSQPSEPDENFNDWFFEGIQGDNTSSIITSTTADKMVDALQLGFTRQSVSVEEAFENGFDTVGDYCYDLLSNEGFEPSYMLIILPFALLAALPFIILKLFNRHIERKYAGYVPAGGGEEKKAQQTAESEAALRAPKKKQRNCEYCGSLYFTGVDKVCPACGAPINAER